MISYLLKKLKLITVLLIILTIGIGTTFLLKEDSFRYKLSCIGTNLKRFLSKENVQIKNYPSKTQLLFDHMKILFKSDSNKLHYIENLAGLQMSFTNYSAIQDLFNEIFIRKCYFFNTKKPNPFIIDAGSNIGISILFFKKIYPEANIIAFEPCKNNFNLLNLNLKNNQIENVKTRQKALSNIKDSIRIYNPGSATSSVSFINQNDKFENVKTTLLSKHINQTVDLLKIDVEGSEGLVIEDLVNNKKLNYIEEIIMEYHPQIKNNELSKIIKALEDNNYKYEIDSPIKTPFSKDSTSPFLIHAYKKST